MPDALGTGVGPLAVGVAAVARDSVLPFHWLPKIVLPLPLKAVPSVSHRLVATQDTEERMPPVMPDGRATGTTDHAVPFQVSATGTELVPPTARQNDEPTQETDVRVSSDVDGTFALGTTLHVVPFHRLGERPATGTEVLPADRDTEGRARARHVGQRVARPSTTLPGHACRSIATRRRWAGWKGPPRPPPGESRGLAVKATNAPAMAMKKSETTHVCSFVSVVPSSGRVPSATGSGRPSSGPSRVRSSRSASGPFGPVVAHAAPDAAQPSIPTIGRLLKRTVDTRRPGRAGPAGRTGLATRNPSAEMTASASSSTTPSQMRLPALTNDAVPVGAREEVVDVLALHDVDGSPATMQAIPATLAMARAHGTRRPSMTATATTSPILGGVTRRAAAPGWRR